MTSGEPIVDRLLVGRAIVNPLGLSPRQYVARKARDCRRRAQELRLSKQHQRRVDATISSLLTRCFQHSLI